jgi:hypothetical protein
MLENANFVALAFWHSRVLLLRAKPADRGERGEAAAAIAEGK